MLASEVVLCLWPSHICKKKRMGRGGGGETNAVYCHINREGRRVITIMLRQANPFR